jgi:hypothetical protein
MINLMSRIKVESFLQKSAIDQYDQIKKLQTLRILSLEEARASKRTVTRSAAKNLAKRGKIVKDPTAMMISTLANNPELLEKLKSMIGD